MISVRSFKGRQENEKNTLWWARIGLMRLLIIRLFPIKLDITWLTTRVINLAMTISLT